MIHPLYNPIEMRTRAKRRVAQEYSGLSLIIIDYLQLMRVPGNSENCLAEVSEISRSLKALAKELKVAIVALSQVNRSLKNRLNKRPIMSDIRESGSIEQDADLILFIYRDEVTENTQDKNVAEIIIGKQRNGSRLVPVVYASMDASLALTTWMNTTTQGASRTN